MADVGMNGCRLNMSHCTPDSAQALAKMVRRVSAERGRPIALGADIRGPKLRIGEVAGGSVVLSDETAAGEYPVEAVHTADQVIRRAEQERARHKDGLNDEGIDGSRLGAVIVVSPDGRSAERLSARRDAHPIIVALERPERANWLATCWGVLPVLVEDCSSEGVVQRALDTAVAAHPSLATRRFMVLEDGPGST